MQEIINSQIQFIQFNRFDDTDASSIVKNNNQEASFNAFNYLINEGFKAITYLGRPEHLAVYNERKKGFIDAI